VAPSKSAITRTRTFDGAERYNGTPFTDRGFQNIPALAHLNPWLDSLLNAAYGLVPDVSRNLS